MKVILLFITLILCNSAMAAEPSSLKIRREQCDPNLMKVWADSQRFQVNAQGRSIDLESIYRLKPPATQPRKRITAWQKHIWEVKGQMVEYRLDHATIRIVLYWDGRYMNVVIPSPVCLKSKTRFRNSIVRAWNFFIARCGTPSAVYRPLGAVVYIRGVGFWANRHLHRRGEAPNGAELHPVTGINAVAGCGT